MTSGEIAGIVIAVLVVVFAAIAVGAVSFWRDCISKQRTTGNAEPEGANSITQVAFSSTLVGATTTPSAASSTGITVIDERSTENDEVAETMTTNENSNEVQRETVLDPTEVRRQRMRLPEIAPGDPPPSYNNAHLFDRPPQTAPSNENQSEEAENVELSDSTENPKRSSSTPPPSYEDVLENATSHL